MEHATNAPEERRPEPEVGDPQRTADPNLLPKYVLRALYNPKPEHCEYHGAWMISLWERSSDAFGGARTTFYRILSSHCVSDGHSSFEECAAELRRHTGFGNYPVDPDEFEVVTVPYAHLWAGGGVPSRPTVSMFAK